jgi:predicted nucleotidyltransferase
MRRTKPQRGNSLFAPRERGGVIGGLGYNFQDAYIVTALPQWLANPAFKSFIKEGFDDVDIVFSAAARRPGVKFKSRLELTEREQADASRRHQEIREYLREKLEIDRDFLTGSYARWTKTKPLKDVDIFFVLGKRERGYRDQHPNVVLEKFRDVLAEKYGKDWVSLGRRSVQVDFGVQVVEDQTNDQVMSVDVVPVFRKDSHYGNP